MQEKNVFVHHVYFWLKNTGNKADRSQLLNGLKSLGQISSIQKFHIGRPAATNRDVIDSSYTFSWLLFFDNESDQESYQHDPVHLKFVKDCSHLWDKVVVYDSIDVID